MEWEFLAPMIVSIVLFVTIGGVLILRPIAKRVGDLLEVYAKEKEGGMEVEMRQMRELLETMDARLQLMEERQDFTERLLTEPDERERPGRGPSASQTPKG